MLIECEHFQTVYPDLHTVSLRGFPLSLTVLYANSTARPFFLDFLFPKLRSLSVQFGADRFNFPLLLCHFCPNLTSLDLNSCSLSLINCGSSIFPNLTNFSISVPAIDDSDLYCLLEMLPASLERLKLLRNASASPLPQQSVRLLCKKYRSLKQFWIKPLDFKVSSCSPHHQHNPIQCLYPSPSSLQSPSP